jgi:hypothetical protein
MAKNKKAKERLEDDFAKLEEEIDKIDPDSFFPLNAVAFGGKSLPNGEDSPDSKTIAINDIISMVKAGDYSLPNLSLKLQEFAFRWATERRTLREWAEIFRVRPSTIHNWKNDLRVVKYAAVIKYKRNALLVERALFVETRAFAKLNEIFDMPINNSNMETIRKSIIDALQIAKDRIPTNTPNFENNVNIANKNENVTIVEQHEINNTVDINTIRQQLDEIELIENVLDEKKDGEGED